MACNGCSAIMEHNESLYGCHDKAAETAAHGGTPQPYCMKHLANLARRGFSIEPYGPPEHLHADERSD